MINTHVHHSDGDRSARGFTLIELLVVMAIIGVLIALLLPAVQAARGAARRVQCLNDMMQIALGLQNYESAFEAFPPGSINPTGPISNTATGYHASWIVQLLPDLEQKFTYNHINFSVSMYDASNQTVRAVRLTTLLCPADPMFNVPGGVVPTTYAGNHHHLEAPIDVNNSGVLFLNSHIRTEDIEDGASNTAAFGEKRIGSGDLGWLSGTNATLRNGGTPLNGPALLASKSNPDPVGGYSSYHPGGANFAFADGHVSFVRNSQSIAIFQRILNRHDGELILEMP